MNSLFGLAKHCDGRCALKHQADGLVTAGGMRRATASIRRVRLPMRRRGAGWSALSVLGGGSPEACRELRGAPSAKFHFRQSLTLLKVALIASARAKASRPAQMRPRRPKRRAAPWIVIFGLVLAAAVSGQPQYAAAQTAPLHPCEGPALVDPACLARFAQDYPGRLRGVPARLVLDWTRTSVAAALAAVGDFAGAEAQIGAIFTPGIANDARQSAARQAMRLGRGAEARRFAEAAMQAAEAQTRDSRFGSIDHAIGWATAAAASAHAGQAAAANRAFDAAVSVFSSGRLITSEMLLPVLYLVGAEHARRGGAAARELATRVEDPQTSQAAMFLVAYLEALAGRNEGLPQLLEAAQARSGSIAPPSARLFACAVALTGDDTLAERLRSIVGGTSTGNVMSERLAVRACQAAGLLRAGNAEAARARMGQFANEALRLRQLLTDDPGWAQETISVGYAAELLAMMGGSRR